MSAANPDAVPALRSAHIRRASACACSIPKSGICSGCARTGNEVAEWPGASAEEKAQIWARLPDRAIALKTDTHLMPWSARGILDWAGTTFQTGAAGTWLVGHGPHALSFDCVSGEPVRLAWGGDRLTATRGEDQFELATHDKLRAFAFGPADAPSLYVLTLPKGRVTVVPSDGPALMDAGSASHPALFDLGVWGGGRALRSGNRGARYSRAVQER